MSADYTYEIKEGVLCIVDLALGGKSVTNDIETVMAVVRSELLGYKQSVPPITIYRDSEKMWDGVEMTDKGNVTFYPIQEEDQDRAIAVAKKRFISKPI